MYERDLPARPGRREDHADQVMVVSLDVVWKVAEDKFGSSAQVASSDQARAGAAGSLIVGLSLIVASDSPLSIPQPA